MDNPRLRGIVERFATAKQLADEQFSDKYQIFINYILLKEIYYQINEEYPFESFFNISLLEDINFGKDGTMAIDGCFLIYKKEIIHLGMDIYELSSKLDNLTQGDLNIVLIQTKDGKLETTDLSTLSDCLNAEFKEQEEWAKFVALRNLIEALWEKNNKINIKFYCYYVSKAVDEATFGNSTFKVRMDALKSAMKKYFWIKKNDDVFIDFYDTEKIYEIYERQEENVSIVTKTVQLVNVTEEIEITNIGKILFGAITFGELMKIIFDKEKMRRNELYEYNVRDEIQDPTIKKEIIKTIKNKGDQFILLNNGITFIVDRQETRGKRGIELENIKIVNGCQTSNAIIDVCKNTNDYDHLQVSIKIIETQKNEALLGNITYSSNNQNAVKKENLISIAPRMFELEKEFKAFDLEKITPFEKVLFERREGQYRGQNIKYIDTLELAKAYISLWEGLPDYCVMYRTEIFEKYIDIIKKDDEDVIKKSIIAGTLWYNIYKQIPRLYDNARYHIFTVITRNNLNLENPDIDQIQKENIPSEIQKVIRAIIECVDENGDIVFPPSTTRGKIHYRKFYKSDALSKIENKYKEISNANPSTNN